ncbi:hypothetical protein LCGC14_0828580, partial [marine sediment metagenome]
LRPCTWPYPIKNNPIKIIPIKNFLKLFIFLLFNCD